VTDYDWVGHWVDDYSRCWSYENKFLCSDDFRFVVIVADCLVNS